VELRRIEVDVWDIGMVQRLAEKNFHLLTEALADATHLRFGDAAVAAQGLHHCVEGLVDPAAWLQPVGEEAALPQFGMARDRSPTWVVSSRLR